MRHKEWIKDVSHQLPKNLTQKWGLEVLWKHYGVYWSTVMARFIIDCITEIMHAFENAMIGAML